MSTFQLRQRSTVLADRYASGSLDDSDRAVVRTGLFVSPTVKLVTPTSVDGTIKSLDKALVTFRRDVAVDACSVAYTDDCTGTDEDVDRVTKCIRAHFTATGKPTTLKLCLECAGLPVTPENTKRFADCVKVREDKFDAVPTGTLAWCAVALRRNLSAGAMSAHSSEDYRSRLETWARQYGIQRDKWADGTWGEIGIKDATVGPGIDQVQPWVNRYNAFRSEFLKAGGKTSAPEIQTSVGWAWWKYGLIGTGVLMMVVLILAAPGIVARRLGGA